MNTAIVKKKKTMGGNLMCVDSLTEKEKNEFGKYFYFNKL